MKMDGLTEARPFKIGWSVELKVLHSWKSFEHQFGSSLHMVLEDKTGVEIQAICKHSLLQHLEKYYRVGEWKTHNHAYIMDFVSQTSITDSNLQCDNRFLDIQDFASIKNGSHDTSILIDVIGEILDFGGVNVVQNARKEVNKVEFTLRYIK
ncbi:unnamed protein product [Eruca vesicaria subsp. sativa]|uniref:Replication protein A 70 kDa DNA-binding subunit B/D first OB fold domain-containing protein n=1 Tax=Eruca vesicaria subsp. sativa TaxID=29727 RepID=A0ABC8K7I0_ERUVS|nr:unnamed protein product [Eruca vesicaria subsp. sativa]